jgi:NAD(P)-dependent dehydrogenase (short-subunit alcohol dehydrogenase family)
VNSAGVTWGAPLEEYPSRAWSKVLNLDLAVPFKVVQASLDLLAAAAQPASPARIINIGSVDGHSVGPFDNYAYQAAKAGLHHLTRVLASRLGARGITVNCIAPGPIRTDMTAETLDRAESQIVATGALPRLADPVDIAGALVYLASRAGAFVTGSVIAVDGGLSVSRWGGRGEPGV